MGYQGINTYLSETIFLFPLHGERSGVTIFTVVTNFNITVLEVPKLQKTIPREANYLPHFAKA
jgi:hypothetical protein